MVMANPNKPEKNVFSVSHTKTSRQKDIHEKLNNEYRTRSFASCSQKIFLLKMNRLQTVPYVYNIDGIFIPKTEHIIDMRRRKAISMV